MRRSSWRRSIICGTVALLLHGTLSCAPAQAEKGRSSPDARQGFTIDEIRRASVTWERRPGPSRQVVDQVCLVPDLPTFLEAIGSWDDEHYFPILIDDVELTFKFLRAFQPARIVRYPKKVASLSSEKVWDEAVAAVGQSWSNPKTPRAAVAKGDAIPERLGPTPPGVVISSPRSPTLAGAVALAAGRFQRLLRWDPGKRYQDVVPAAEARDMALRIERLIADRVPRYERLGDDCDFITLAGDWPYRYEDRALGSFDHAGVRAFDDLVGRIPETQTRWAFCGRLLGDETAGVYQAMCSLFLQPGSALLFNSYPPREQKWAPYAMDLAAERLGRLLPVVHRSGDRAGLSGWHQAFDTMNRSGLVLINTHGNPALFNLAGGPGQTADVPLSRPSVVVMIHSFSAADPADPRTLAGRWLAAGAFLYFGSINEPYLEAFRTPTQFVALAAASIPLSAALRQSPPETFGQPWRLIYLGDPLFRLDPARRRVARVAPPAPFATWPRYIEYQSPGAGATDDTRLSWALKTAVFRLQRGEEPRGNADLPSALLAIRRDRLTPNLRPLYDALLADTLTEAGRWDDLGTRLALIPPAERSPLAQRLIETIQLAHLQKLLEKRERNRAEVLWDELVRSRAAREVKAAATERVSRLVESSSGLREWRVRLRSAARDLAGSPDATVVDAELKRVEDTLRPSKTRGGKG